MEMMIAKKVKKEEDMISRLPSDVLSQIVSFLELKEAVKTSVLSKRWEKVWTCIRCIHLDTNTCFHDEFVHDHKVNKRRKSFFNFVNGILIGNTNNNRRILSSLTRFYLEYSVGRRWHPLCPPSEPPITDEEIRKAIDEEIPYLIRWIGAAIRYPNLQYFGIKLAEVPPIKMPPLLFKCQRLVTLYLSSSSSSNNIYLDVPENVSMSSLEELHLTHVVYKDENSLKNLLLGCPVLEQLVYIGQITNNKLFVCSPSLKILRVMNQGGRRDTGIGNSYVVEAPRLEYLSFQEHNLSDYTMSASPCLVSAVIDILSYVSAYHSRSLVFHLFQGISHVQNLELCINRRSPMLRDMSTALLGFQNLIHFKLRSRDVDILPIILQCLPHLKHLIFIRLASYPVESMWVSPEQIPQCLALHLETIEIGLYYWEEDEIRQVLKMIEYLLNKGKVLKKMIIGSSNPYIKPKINLFSRASSDCQIVFKYFL